MNYHVEWSIVTRIAIVDVVVSVWGKKNLRIVLTFYFIIYIYLFIYLFINFDQCLFIILKESSKQSLYALV